MNSKKWLELIFKIETANGASFQRLVVENPSLIGSFGFCN